MFQTTVIRFRESVQFQQFLIAALVLVLMVLAGDAVAATVATEHKMADAAPPQGTGSSVYAPYVVAVFKRNILSCSGFLLSKRYVGVGCHCIADLEKPGRPRLNGVKLIDYDFVAGVTSPRAFKNAKNTRKPKAVLTHPFCENGPPRMFDIGIAVMEEPFPTIRDVIEVYDLLSTDSQDFTQSLNRLFSWKRPQDAPNCTYAGWKTSDFPENNQLKTVAMVNFHTAECKKLWREEVPAQIPENFSFSYPEQFCLVTRDATEDEITLPDDGPFVCNRLHVGFVSYGPERRTKTRRAPIVTQSLAIVMDWIQYDSYFENIGCFGTHADCSHDDEKSEAKSAAIAYMKMEPCSRIILLVYALNQFTN